MTINTEIKEVLRSFNIPVDDGLAYLISIYFDVRPSYIPISIVEKIKRSGVILLDDNKTIQWCIPLFDEQVTGFEWVSTEWLELFRSKNKERTGGPREAISRMKKFFAKYPEIRKDDVMEGTKMYLKSVLNPHYIITSHYFISKGIGADRIETLLHWVNTYRESIKDEVGRTTYNNVMKG